MCVFEYSIECYYVLAAQPILFFQMTLYSQFYILSIFLLHAFDVTVLYTGLSKKMDGIWNRYNLKSTERIYTFGVLKCSQKFKLLDLP